MGSQHFEHDPPPKRRRDTSPGELPWFLSNQGRIIKFILLAPVLAIAGGFAGTFWWLGFPSGLIDIIVRAWISIVILWSLPMSIPFILTPSFYITPYIGTILGLLVWLILAARFFAKTRNA